MGIPYRDKIVAAILSGDEEKAHNQIQLAVDAMSVLMQLVIDNTDPADYPLMTASMRMTAAQIEAHFNPAQLRLADALKEKLIGVTEVIKEDET